MVFATGMWAAVAAERRWLTVSEERLLGVFFSSGFCRSLSDQNHGPNRWFKEGPAIQAISASE